jgi:hypothetical protein
MANSCWQNNELIKAWFPFNRKLEASTWEPERNQVVFMIDFFHENIH